MARHRNVRSMNYDEEYEGYYDVYGHSAEDDYCVSPNTASEFIYDRNSKAHSMSAFLSPAASDTLPEEDEDSGGENSLHRTRTDSLNGHQPKLNQNDKAKLQACMEEMQNVVGDTIPEATLLTAAMQHNFSAERALDAVLSSGDKPKPQRIRRERHRMREGGSKGNGNGLFKSNATSKSSNSSEDVSIFAKEIGRMQFTTDESENVSEEKNSKGNELLQEDISGEDNSVSFGNGNGNEPENNKSSIEETNDKIKSADQKLEIITAPVTNNDSYNHKVARSKVSEKDLLMEYKKERSDGKPLINLVVIGHVDAGKSTLMGHLLYRLGCVGKKMMHKYEQDSKKLGKASFMYAWVLDETSEERTRGITMDVAQSRFETPHRIVTLLDAPGHKDFIPNMITGAAQADVAILVVDATRGEFETGFETGGQTREHTLLIRSLGVSQLAVAVNKLDNVDWSQERYNEIVSKLGTFLRQAGFKDSDVICVPCSGLTGENLTESAQISALKSWYNGPYLVEVIDNFKPPERPISKPFRLCIVDVFKGMGAGFCISGRIEAGYVQNGDRMLMMPAGEQVNVKGITIDESSVHRAFAGDHVTLQVAGMDINKVTTGNVICDISQPVKVTSRFRARVVVFSVDVPITRGYPVVIHYQSMCEQAVVRKLVSQLHKSTGQVVKKKPRCLAKNSSAVIELEVTHPICVELYKDYRELGRFMLRTGGSTIAAGLVTEIM